jgi:hypothetical protein
VKRKLNRKNVFSGLYWKHLTGDDRGAYGNLLDEIGGDLAGIDRGS